VETGVNIAEKRGPLLEMHHAWRHKATADPITPYKMYLFLIIPLMMYQLIQKSISSWKIIHILNIKCNQIEVEK